ncbi:hypothetical protein B0T22DRAFT_73167 [Podospora appendiculata]|uniref:Uncharacterized protein n=1 Tax=Podospora appendiculata TaxID=314037 RepID=A0AAE0XJA8_9PEZI|nr:hypothetical protein B0T22DRAFT_73167 [Podospora appendiculata]
MPVPFFRIPVPVFEPSLGPAVLGTTTRSRLRYREEPPQEPASQKPKATTIIIAALIAGIAILVTFIIFIRSLRSRHPNPKYIPTPFLKRLWTGWKVPSYHTSHAYEQAGVEEDNTRRSNGMQEGNLGGVVVPTQVQGAAATAGVDRNTSVRSVMTLPVYRPKATDTEQVLGREGERDGIDVVVEMPTAEDDEALREEEMAALYQIRVARRRQIAEREERRRLRLEARETNNIVALQELRQQVRTQPTRNAEEIESLRQEHERLRETRQRAVSSVSYAELGVARADGTRLRANSTESERVGLLSDAASIGQRTGAESLLHRRERSGSSVLSIDTARSIERQLESPGPATEGSVFSLASVGRSRADSGANTPRLSTRAGSSPEIIDAEDGDLGDTGMPPPGYDEVSLDEAPTRSDNGSAMSGRNSPYNEPPPEYPGPAQTRNARLSVHMGDLAVQALPEEGRQRRLSRGGATAPQLPDLEHLPQIIIDPSSARP